MEKIKVLMIGPDRSVHGGISGVVNNYYEAGLDKKIDLTYIGTMVDGSKLRKLFKAMEAYIRFCIKLFGNQIVHVNMASDSSYYRKAIFIRTAKHFHKKIVIHQHGGDFQTFYHKQLSEKGKRRLKETLAMGDAFLVLASVWKDFFSELVDPQKIIVFPDTISIRAPFEKKYGQHKILFLGRLCRAKGLCELIQTAPALKKACEDVKIYLGGSWEDEELKALVDKYPDMITWIGWVTGKKKQEYLRECDIFVLPSYFEGQSLSILEAMASYCAVVASRTGGIPQMIMEDETGILVNPRDAEDLERGLLRALEDPRLCKSLGDKAREKVEKEFNIVSNMEQLLEIYRKVCGVNGNL